MQTLTIVIDTLMPSFKFILLASITLGGLMTAQKYEIGGKIGVVNLVGDIGSSNYLLSQYGGLSDNAKKLGLPLAGGAFFRMNFNPHQTLRLDVGYGHLQFDDLNAKEDYRKKRSFWGSNDFYEGAIIGEYQFFPVNNEQQTMLSPYIFAGIGGMIADHARLGLQHDFVRDADGRAIMPSFSEDFVTTSTYSTITKFTGFVPFGVGLKYKFNYNWALNAEVMFRAVFTDGLDFNTFDEKDFQVKYNADIIDPGTGISLLESQPYKSIAEERKNAFIKDRKVGNLESKDWVNTLSIGLSYSFGRPPCYCD